ncbi:hypothetical protein RUM44_008429 [Polyplax serrata]|uniref:DEP domain-containing protein n=1 Tax=Polyplax serrata TaxID=468196 RepID=A0ABR1BCP7_POLSC
MGVKQLLKLEKFSPGEKYSNSMESYDLIEWLMERLDIEESVEAVHIANQLCNYGYFFPVSDSKNLIVKDDSSFYRFQVNMKWNRSILKMKLRKSGGQELSRLVSKRKKAKKKKKIDENVAFPSEFRNGRTVFFSHLREVVFLQLVGSNSPVKVVGD